ncbi:UDP-glycosyltransferase 1 [Artemisia annua]|uniref:Glycosyltransferase n=1 Tax=Artemisia annua TaxID=35608 RepID=A0A2U1N0E1_ARTAN|nr:UDP-glycosyltransferase 1 [Artemisia annua]
MENVVVMYPSLGIGHLISMVELGELIISQDPTLTIKILLTPQHYETKSTANYIKNVTSATPTITFHHLPTLPNPPDYSTPFFDLVFELIKSYNPIVHDTLLSISKNSNIKGVILDFLSNDAFDVCKSLDLPTYYLFTGSAFGVGMMLYLSTIHNTTSESFKDMRSYIEVPGTPPIYCLDMPVTLLDRNFNSYKNVIKISTNMTKAKGLIVNSFAALEPRFMKSLTNGEHIPDGPTPQLYFVGPLIRGDSSDNSNDKCLNWLNSQPKKSVVVLIFGSIGKFKNDQLMEIAKGLEKSGQRFLWVVRNPPPENEKEHAFALKEPELDNLLPVGFLGRTKEKGLVVKNWSPQGEILRHKSVGGFVCHCGWNSVLEAMHAGVPLIAWPLYAEQKMNRVHLVKGIKVALWLKMSEDGFVTADELAERLKELMVEESGKKLREHVEEMSASAKAAMVDGGSSRVALAELVGSLNSVQV